ncbi:MAG TPA: hypothetical protein VGM12_26420 [Trebonia sp.]
MPVSGWVAARSSAVSPARARNAAVVGSACPSSARVFATPSRRSWPDRALPAPAPHAALGQPGVLRAVLTAGAYPALIALIGLGLGAVLRHTAGAICAVVATLFLLPLLIAPLGAATQDELVRFLPEQIAALSLTAVRPASPALPPAVAFALLCVYAAAALAAGAWALARRDA